MMGVATDDSEIRLTWTLEPQVFSMCWDFKLGSSILDFGGHYLLSL
jgi:hypothetical protein